MSRWVYLGPFRHAWRWWGVRHVRWLYWRRRVKRYERSLEARPAKTDVEMRKLRDWKVALQAIWDGGA